MVFRIGMHRAWNHPVARSGLFQAPESAQITLGTDAFGRAASQFDLKGGREAKP